MQEHKRRLLRQYGKPSYLTKLAESHYLSRTEPKVLYEKQRDKTGKNSYLLGIVGTQPVAGRKGEAYLNGLGQFGYQSSMARPGESNSADTGKVQRMEVELVELKTDGSHFEFLIREIIMNRIVQWEDLPDVDTVRKYLRKHPFPEDKLFSEEEFVSHVEKAEGYIDLVVEKRETAEFVCLLLYRLVSKCSSSLKGGGKK
jgi:hypothetical protein